MTPNTRERFAAALDRHQNGDVNIFPNWRAIRKEPRFECDPYLDFIREQKCLVCTVVECDPHHVYHKGATGNHASDLLTVPLCRRHHSQLHSSLFGTNELFERHFAVHFHSSIVRFLQRWFKAKGWPWLEWQNLLHLEATVWANLQREANPG